MDEDKMVFGACENSANGGCGSCSSSAQVSEVLKKEETIRHKTDENGVSWFKVYFGGGAHYENWRAQAEEIFGKENIMVEEVPMPSLKCFEDAAERAFRVWVKEKNQRGKKE